MYGFLRSVKSFNYVCVCACVRLESGRVPPRVVDERRKMSKSGAAAAAAAEA